MDAFFYSHPHPGGCSSIASITLGLKRTSPVPRIDVATKNWIGLGLDWVKTKTDAIQFKYTKHYFIPGFPHSVSEN